MDLESVKGEIERVVVTDEQLQVRLKEIAAQIEADYKNRPITHWRIKRCSDGDG